jgi:predicted transcriptional regulator
MSGRWFRMYDELLDDPKVQKLPAEDFRGWVNLLCLASKNEGRLPSITDIAFALRVTEDAVSTLLERLRSGGLIARRSGGTNGAYDAPYKWEERQYKSDTSTQRVKRFRQRSKTVTETPSEPDTESEEEKKKRRSTEEPRATDELPPGITDARIAYEYVCRAANWRPANDTQRQTAISIIHGWLDGSGLGCSLELVINAIGKARQRNPEPTKSLKRFDSTIRGMRKDQLGGELPISSDDVRKITEGVASRMSVQ